MGPKPLSTSLLLLKIADLRGRRIRIPERAVRRPPPPAALAPPTTALRRLQSSPVGARSHRSPCPFFILSRAVARRSAHPGRSPTASRRHTRGYRPASPPARRRRRRIGLSAPPTRLCSSTVRTLPPTKRRSPPSRPSVTPSQPRAPSARPSSPALPRPPVRRPLPRRPPAGASFCRPVCATVRQPRFGGQLRPAPPVRAGQVKLASAAARPSAACRRTSAVVCRSSPVVPLTCAISEYLSKDLPYKLSPDDVYVTGGCTQAIEIILSVLAHPGANILLPRPGFPLYEARAAFSKLEARHFDLVPERGWEVDLDNVEALADENTVAMVVINPGNPCGNVFTYQHLNQIAETAKKLGIMVIADEVYDHVTFGSNPFVPMGAFGEIAPVITLGSISKRWVVPGWRLGWLVINDPKDFLKQTKIAESIESFLDITTDPATLIQGAVPHILKSTKDDFFNKIIYILRQASDICHQKLEEIDCITCPYKPEGSMFVMAKLDFSYLEGIKDCVDFCCKLAKEESVIVLPGITVGLKNWIRITFAIDPSSLSIALDRIKLFCLRHANKNKVEAASATRSDVI
ncbi:uncharacterized protein A4U43_C09F8000 [Asparagus officinalis]|uniref:Aminotransferase class I/classII large domain-containing protein n=1 Tax=Asparagus officinalis TaxID=4686 RepID=A0A5P1E6K1_ASPOF|nr:uncharacterized protein A4U43_C09F8000 [Asparagus officinalis]